MIKMPQVKYDLIDMKGGWDQNTPTQSLPAGYVRDALNFECNVNGGYTRIAGYERFDGRTSPSDALYSLVFVAAYVGVTPVAGDTVNDATTGATAIVLATDNVVNGQVIAISKRVGSFVIGNNLRVGVTVVGAMITPTQAISNAANASYLSLAANLYRTDIQPVPGSGRVLGTIFYKDILYAFRNNAGGTAVDLYKSSAAGWVSVPFFYEVRFSAASTYPAEGATLTQGGVTATVKRVCLQSGAYLGGTAAGKMIIAAPAGGNFAAGAFTGGMTGTCVGIQTAITMLPGGKIEYVLANFFGGSATNRAYAADGINRAFEFDGTVLVPIDTGSPSDTPKHIAAHNNYLMLSIGASVLYSGVGEPYNWSGGAFAGEIATGEEITGIIPMPGGTSVATLLITSRDNTFMLYGKDTSTFNFVTYNSGSGAADYTVQNMADTYMMSEKGIVSLKTSLNYGNFDQATLTHNIELFIRQHRTKAVCTTLARRKSQYRIFFNDGYGLYVTVVNGQVIGLMPIYFPDTINMSDECIYSNGEDATFLSANDSGYVYQLDKGTSFDGEPIDAFFTLKYQAVGSSRILKRYRKASFEMSGSAYFTFNFGYLLGYSASSISQPLGANYVANVQTMQWDNFTWDAFIWDGQSILPTECQMNGTAENVAITIRSGSASIAPYTVNSAIIHYTERRGMR